MDGFEVLNEVYKKVSENSLNHIFFSAPARNDALLYSDMEEMTTAWDDYSGAELFTNKESKKVLLSYGRRTKVFTRGGSHLSEDERLERIILMELNPGDTDYEAEFKSFVKGCSEYSHTGTLISADKDTLHLSCIFSEYVMNNIKDSVNKDNIKIWHRKILSFEEVKININDNDNSKKQLILLLAELAKKYIKEYNGNNVMRWDLEHYPMHF